MKESFRSLSIYKEVVLDEGNEREVADELFINFNECQGCLR